MSVLDLDVLKYDPGSVQVGDRVSINNQEYIVNKVVYKGGVDTVPTVRFECEAIQYWPPRTDEYTLYIPNIRIESLLEKPYFIRDEISENTREEFVKLLME